MSGGRPAKYAYPQAVGEETRNPAADKRAAKRIMSLASQRAAHFRVVYRCRYDRVERIVIMRRAA